MTARPDWPPEGTRDLARAFEALAAGVRDLEAGLYAGTLERELAREDLALAVGPEVLASYAALVDARAPSAGARRTETVRQLLEETRAELVRVERSFPAELAPGSLTEDARLAHGARVRVLDGDGALLRLDQAISARFWGIAFEFREPAHEDLLARTLLRDAAANLATDLTDLARILVRIGEEERFPSLVPTLKNRAFERLIVDVLNEDRRAAHSARLAQDYSQKTDLRYDTARGLGRQRGARVQVTSLTSVHLHDQKLARIVQRDKLVFFSPIELARLLDAELHGRRPFHAPIDRELLTRLWSALGTPATVGELANAFAQRFRNALSDPASDPRGPLARLPAPVRELVREFVDKSAVRSTRLLRAYEARFGPDSSRRDGRMRHQRVPPPSTPLEAWSGFLRAHGPGSIARARVASHAGSSLWALTEEGVEVFVLLGARGDAPALGAEVDVLLLDASHDRRWFTAVVPGTDPEGVLHGLRTQGVKPARVRGLAAWSTEEVRALVVGDRRTGRVVKRLPYGLLVELLPDVAGLLHENGMAGRSPGEFDVGATVEVVVARLDLAALRIELALAPPASAGAEA
ncbi:MAG: hypothetical protein U1F29_02740 [Planctomycetota bacterium]